jgi:hypothetical protein
MRHVLLSTTLLLQACVLPYRYNDSGQTRFEIGTLRRAIAAYETAHGALPADLQDICPGIPAWCRDELWPGIPPFTDQWRRPLLYERLGKEYVIRSSGPDRRAGTKDDVWYQPSVESQVVKTVAGCYHVETRWKDYPRTAPLVLDTATLRVGMYRAAPRLLSYPFPYWEVRGVDSIVVVWPGAESARLFYLLVSPDTLRGAGPHGPVAAVRLPC